MKNKYIQIVRNHQDPVSSNTIYTVYFLHDFTSVDQ